MNNTIQTINIEEIMEEIRRDIAEKGYKNEYVKFSDIPNQFSMDDFTHTGQLGDNIRSLQASYNIVSYRPLISTRKLGSLVIFIKKVLRKLTKFYVEPIVSDQSTFNNLSTICIRDLYLDVEELRLKVQFLQEENKYLQNKLSKNKKVGE